MNPEIIDILGTQLGEDFTGKPIEYILLKMMERIQFLERVQLGAAMRANRQAQDIDSLETSMLSSSKAVNQRLSLIAEEVFNG